MHAQDILTTAYLSLKPFGNEGQLINEADYHGSQILASASGYLHNQIDWAPYIFRKHDTVKQAAIYLHWTEN
jgi:hypothetical protein